ncbi:hypothetical protein EVG20_g10076 [Dentipellis fragilis]|uniref:Uncharacterized protein n=1 Tax=Dentipellis fragilis TaxID=205917 RepID=A0A4Y9XTS7_9AGAM|nr:hypothetical protein EVG20_g10076 [Dentipellis fragilis]
MALTSSTSLPPMPLVAIVFVWLQGPSITTPALSCTLFNSIIGTLTRTIVCLLSGDLGLYIRLFLLVLWISMRNVDKVDCVNKNLPAHAAICKKKAAQGCDRCTPCCVANPLPTCKSAYHAKKIRSQAVPAAPSRSMSGGDAAPAPVAAAQTETPVQPEGTAASITAYSEPVHSIWTPQQAMAAYLRRKQDTSRVAEQSARSADVLENQEILKKTVMFRIWAEANEPSLLQRIFIPMHPSYVPGSLPDLIDALPAGASKCEIFSRDFDGWVPTGLDAAILLEAGETDVCVRAPGLLDAECINLPSYAIRTHSGQLKRRLRDSVDSSDLASPSPKRLKKPSLPLPSPSPSPHPLPSLTPRAPTVGHQADFSDLSVDVALSPRLEQGSIGLPVETSRSTPTRTGRLPSAVFPRTSSQTVKFPSQYSFAEVVQFAELVDKYRVENPAHTQDALDMNFLGICTSKSTFKQIMTFLHCGNRNIWDEYFQKSGTSGGLWPRYRMAVSHLPHDNNSPLPWSESMPIAAGPQLHKEPRRQDSPKVMQQMSKDSSFDLAVLRNVAPLSDSETDFVSSHIDSLHPNPAIFDSWHSDITSSYTGIDSSHPNPAVFDSSHTGVNSSHSNPAVFNSSHSDITSSYTGIDSSHPNPAVFDSSHSDFNSSYTGIDSSHPNPAVFNSSRLNPVMSQSEFNRLPSYPIPQSSNPVQSHVDSSQPYTHGTLEYTGQPSQLKDHSLHYSDSVGFSIQPSQTSIANSWSAGMNDHGSTIYMPDGYSTNHSSPPADYSSPMDSPPSHQDTYDTSLPY